MLGLTQEVIMMLHEIFCDFVPSEESNALAAC